MKKVEKLTQEKNTEEVKSKTLNLKHERQTNANKINQTNNTNKAKNQTKIKKKQHKKA